MTRLIAAALMVGAFAVPAIAWATTLWVGIEAALR